MKRSRSKKDRESDKSSTPSLSSKNSDKTRPIPRFSLRRIFLTQSPSFRTKATPKRSYESSSSSGGPDHDYSSGGGNTSSLQPVNLSCKSNSDSHQSVLNGRECALCLCQHAAESFPDISTCGHRSCIACFRQYLMIEITESRVNITCPECPELMHPDDIKAILVDSRIFVKYEDFMVRRFLASDPDSRWCPAPDCGYAVIATGCASCPKLKCERDGCGTYFCYHCKQYWHPNQTCDTARAKRRHNSGFDDIMYDGTSGKRKDDIKPCPRCSALIIKMDDGSCNHMSCSMCGAEFCWLCMKEISDLHYLSPSGCTFWGKKPWSRKKKILWQLGTLVGAPLGISLMAGIAVPALIIGIPVWVGKKVSESGKCRLYKEVQPGPSLSFYLTMNIPDKFRLSLTRLRLSSHNLRVERGRWERPKLELHRRLCQCGADVEDEYHVIMLYTRFETSPRHRRNLLVTGAVTLSIVTAPVVAVLTVGIGVPILLAYVYGVVPISLCRSGGCGVTTSEGGGVRFEFDENYANGTTTTMGGDTQSVGTGHNVTNPSIAPSIGEASVAMSNSLSASGSHMERMGILRDESDQESSSNRAIAGYSLNGSIYDAGIVNSLYHKMEVHADVSSMRHKRASLSSESANLSIGDKSATISYGDDASVRALAGSIGAPRDKDLNSVNTLMIREDSTLTGNHCGSDGQSSSPANRRKSKPQIATSDDHSLAETGTDPTNTNTQIFTVTDNKNNTGLNSVKVTTGSKIVTYKIEPDAGVNCMPLKRKWSTASAGARLRGDHVKFNIDGATISTGDNHDSGTTSTVTDSTTTDYLPSKCHHLTDNYINSDKHSLTDVETIVKPPSHHKVLVHRSFSTGSLSERKIAPKDTSVKQTRDITVRVGDVGPDSEKSTSFRSGGESNSCVRRRSCEYAYKHGRISPRITPKSPAPSCS